MKKLKFLLFLFIISFTTLFAQNEANNWYFGKFAGIDFNSGTATAVTDGAMQQYEGCAAISNTFGELLFYTNGINVWNSKHQQMPDGYGLHGNPSTSQVVIIPLPENNDIYYIITADNNAGSRGLCYTIVDMTLDNSKGNISSKNNLIYTPSSEKMGTVRHTNETDIWLVTHPLGTNEFYTYLITATGIQTSTPVISAKGSTITGTSGVPRGHLKISPSGQKLAVGIEGMNKYELFDFDRTTGNIANCITLDNNYYKSAYGVEFSADEHYLYGSERWGNNLWRFDLWADDIPASVEQIATLSSSHGGALQLGTDNKIYLARYNDYLGVIENPEDENSNFTDNAFFLENKSSVEGLPGYLADFFGKLSFSYQNTCFNDETVFTIHTNEDINNVEWNFNYPSSNPIYHSTELNPIFIYPASGNYTIELIAQYTDGSSDTLYKDIRIYELPQPDLSSYNEVCDNTSIDAGEGYTSYLWSTGETTQTITINTPGTYSVTVTDYKGCLNSDVIDITTVYSSPEITYETQNATIVGISDGSIDVTVTGGTPAYSYLWDTGETTEDLNNISAGCYEITVSDQNSCTDNENICISGPAECDTATGFEWAKSAGGTSYLYEQGEGISTDAAGNIYITGAFSGTADFGTHNLTSHGNSDIFIAKYNSLGECLWAKRAGGTVYDSGYGISTDAEGNIYITGNFCYTADFGTHSLTSAGNNDIFITKYNSSGECLWAKKAGGTSSDYGRSISSYAEGNVYITGSFNGTADFGIHSLTSESNEDIFLAKYNSSGECLWAERAGGMYEDEGKGISTDEQGNIYITGDFEETADFGTHSLTAAGSSYSPDIFIAKYNSSGECLWAKRAGSTWEDDSKGINTDAEGNIYITGNFYYTADFGTHSLTSAGNSDIFITKYNSLGECLWAKKAGGTASDYGWSISSDAEGNIYITGKFYGTANFGTHSLTSDNMGFDIFITKYNSLGECLWAKRAGGSDSYAINTDAERNIYVTGKFSYSADFGTHSLTSAGGHDIFIAKYNDKIFNINNIEFSGTSCDYTNSCIDLEIEDGVVPYSYLWSTGETTEDICGVTTGEYSVTVVDAADCYVDSTIIVTVPDTLNLFTTVINVSEAGASDGSIDLTVFGGTAPYQYLWSNGATTEDLDNLPAGIYEVTVADAHECTATTTVVIIEPDSPISLDFITTLDCASGTNGTIDLIVIGGTSPYNYLWSNGETIEDISGLSEAWYSVRVDDGTYVALDSVYLSSDNIVETQLTGENTCQSASNGYIDLIVEGGTTPYNFLWSNGSTTQNITDLSAGTYDVIVTDDTGCTAYDTLSIYEDVLPGAAGIINGESEFCLPVEGYENIYNTSLIQDATSYNWSLTPPEAGTISGNGTQGFVDWLWGFSGQVSIQVAGSNHCGLGTASDIKYVDVHSAPTASINDLELCSGNTADFAINLTGEAPWDITYTFGTYTTTVTTSDNPYIITVTEAGVYEVTELSDANCTGIEFGNQATVIVNNLPTASISGDATICSGESTDITVNLTGEAPWDITYTDGTYTTTVTTSDNPYIITVTEAGVYEITALSDANCTGTELGNQATIIVNDLPTASISGDATICEGETTDISILLTGTAPWDITYTDGTTPTTITTSDNPYVFTVSEAGVYEVTELSDANCTGTEFGGQAIITVEPLPLADFSYTTNKLEVSFTNLSQNAGSYLWDFDDSQTSNEEHPVHTYAEEGSYNVSLTATSDNCGDAVYTETVTVSSVGLSDPEILKVFKIYPNPTSGTITFEINNPKNDIVKVEIFDINGQKVLLKTYDFGKSKETINLNYLAKGIYTVKISYGGKTAFQKLVLQD